MRSRSRDDDLVDAVARMGALTTSQAMAACAYPSRTTVQRAIRRLVADGRITRHRATSPGGEWIVTPRRPPGDISHRLAVADVWAALGCPADWHPEFRIGEIRADALWWHRGDPWLVEVERTHTGTRRKLQLYILTAAGREWRGVWDAFPRLLLVVRSPASVSTAEGWPSPPKIVTTLESMRKDVILHGLPDSRRGGSRGAEIRDS